MENFILFTLSLEKLTILSGMLLMIAIVFITYDVIIRYKANKTVVNESDLPNMDITILSKKQKDYKFAHRFSIIAATILLIGSLTILFTASIFKQKAIKYGAYGEFDKTESISSISKNTQYGFIDQSNELPDNLSGAIIIYFKYGCQDCANIHDDMMSYLTECEIGDYYFVNTRSDKGNAVLNKYPVEAVPMATYIFKNPTSTTYHAMYMYSPDNNGDAVFIRNNLDILINFQKEGV